MRTVPRRPALAAVASACALLGATALVAGPAQTAGTPAGPTVGGCPVFPAGDAWNRDVSGDPVDPQSATYLGAEARGAAVHLDLGTKASEGYGIPFVTVKRGQRRLPIRFGVDGEDYRGESDRGRAPIPATAPIEGGTPRRPDPAQGDRHVLVVERGRCILTELYHAQRVRSGGKVVAWRASSVARFDLRHPTPRPAGWTSADAAGLPILPGLLRHGEAAGTGIHHALRVTLPVARKGYTAPARHCGPSERPDVLPYGARLRLKASFAEGRYRGPALAIVRALKRYGLIFADQGSALYVSGTTDPGWSSALEQLHGGAGRIPWDAFEVLQLGRVTRC